MENLNEHDITKKMLNIIRESEIKAVNDLEEGDLSESIDLNEEELNGEQKKFMQIVSPRVNFEEFKIYPKASNVVFSGKFQDMNGMAWQFTMSETRGLYIKADNLQLTDEAIEIIQKLTGYYEVWVGEWANKLSTDYKTDMNQPYEQ